MNPYRAYSPCTPAGCVRHGVPPVPASVTARRVAALVRALGGGGPLPVRAADVLAALGVTIDVTGVAGAAPAPALSEPGPVGTLIVANHRSWLDIVGLLAIEPVAFLAKREVESWPWVSSIASRHGTVFVDRWALRTLPEAVAAVADRLRSGRSVVVFPEATTFCSDKGGRFRPAAFQAALDAGAPIRPVSLSYRQCGRESTVPAFVGDDTLARSMARVLRADDLSLRVRLHPALEPVGDRRELACQAQRAVTSGERVDV
ncbi:lysophospholipid acyltransferase family protein [Saccharomonospora xinjiangensis]|uniref:1-acyl-sn-glycerol-3-phosphate acyltransferase n=1 Tax=Saccharomonospora xinjiangensis XJ-54 TaxID=882086 RepID=I0V1K9_9PSEU|nr:lysophospholipid acyltransferase family protein [Saccharomonospora xinjiangensis]EID54012.1 1-acyl-sn-glycerol-3-phosphate acyltransferase [Saccharomonospora xinjiangensis XJ-54]